MSGAHTPGPWHVENPQPHGCSVAASERHGFALVAWCGTSSAFGSRGSRVISAKETEANARLIAAAPDLLKAARDLLASNGDAETWEPAIAAARAAIAKAEGRP